jgi:hypothetical protein
MNKKELLMVAVVVCLVATPVAISQLDRSKLGFVIRVDPNISQYYSNFSLIGSGPYLYNDSTDMYVNETYLNDTIDTRFTGAEVDPHWTGNLTACASGNHLFFTAGSLDCEVDDDNPDTDAEVPDDITIDSTKFVNTTLDMEMNFTYNCFNASLCWRTYVNESGYLIMEEV